VRRPRRPDLRKRPRTPSAVSAESARMIGRSCGDHRRSQRRGAIPPPLSAAPSYSPAPVTSRSPRHRALIRLLACRGVPAWLPRLSRTRRRRLSSHRNTATPTARWRPRLILQSSEEPTDIVDVQGGRLHRREVPATVEVGPVSAGQRMDVHDMVDEIGCLISRSLCWGTITPGPRSSRPPSSGAVRWRQMNSVRRSRVLEMDVRAAAADPPDAAA
jgi:hypothetical protein